MQKKDLDSSSEITLPIKVESFCYADFLDWKDILKLVVPKIKFKFVGEYDDYMGIFYLGSVKDPKNKALIKEIKQYIKLCKETE